MPVSKFVEARWDAVESYLRHHRRKSAVLFFLIVFLPQWVPPAKAFFWDNLPAQITAMNLGGLDFSWLRWSLWNWVTVPAGLFLIWRSLRRQPQLSGALTIRHIPSDSLEGKTIKINELTAQIATKDNEIKNLKWSIEQITGQRDGALEAYKTCRQNFTLERFKRFAEENPSTKVKIRSAGYGDWDLVKQIKYLFETHGGWKVEIDPNNVPPLVPNEHFKVLLETNDAGILHRLQGFLDESDGALLPVKTAIKHSVNITKWELIVEVLPTPNK